MWAAANSGASRSRRCTNDHLSPNHESDSSEWDSECSDERSTTESIHEASGKLVEKTDEEFRGSKRSLQHQRCRRRRKKKQKREETPEATMARLTASYSAAMGAVGALHRASKQICKENAESMIYDSQEQNDDQHVECDTQVNYSTTSPEKQLDHARMTVQKVAQSARTTLERSLLLDPVILAPIFLPSVVSRAAPITKIRAMAHVTNNNCENNIPSDLMASAFLTAWNQADKALDTLELYRQLSLAKWKKLTAAHKCTVKQIAYLSLVNYADLLLCGCACCHSCSSDILDRRPVQSLEALKLFQDNCDDEQCLYQNHTHHTSCLWRNESREQTLRLALSSYCDASELDPTDPTLWFKIACTARSLGRLVDKRSISSNKVFDDPSIFWKPRSYRSLERLALECGLRSLPKGVPPNRMLSKAWREMEKWDQCRHGQIILDEDDSVMDTDKSAGQNRPIELVIHLQKYSWSTLGRILITACKEGAGYGRSPLVASHVWSTNCRVPEDFEFGSPLIDIRISPLLCLPHHALGIICEYLASEDVKNLASTCKSLPSEIQTAHEIDNHCNMDPKVPASKNDENRVESVQPPTSASVVEQEKPDNSTTHDIENMSEIRTGNRGAGRNATGTCSAPATNAKQPKGNTHLYRVGRASKRVRSLMLTSEKETERQANRSSVEYCFLAGTLSCTAQNPLYSKIITAEFHWEQLPVLRPCLEFLEAFSGNKVKNQRGKRRSDTALVGTSHSLSNFIKNVSRKNSGPRHLLDLFLVHVASNPADVFESSRGDLTNCYLDCFDLSTSRHEESVEAGYNSIWYCSGTNESTVISLEMFSVNLLAAELRLKRAEYQGTEHDIRNDAALLAFLVPTLLQFVVSISPTRKNKCRFIELECRCFWLASAYYFWLSYCSSDPLASAEGERLGMEYISKALKCLFINESMNSQSGIEIKTPHLHSSIREGHHWSVLSCETLSVYHEHLQSSSVVSRAREEFLTIHQSVQSQLSVDQTAKLTSVGRELLDWYWKGNETSKGSFVEVVNDFIFHHQDLFERTRPHPESTTSSEDWLGEFYWGKALWNSIPYSRAACISCFSTSELSRPSIIQVLICSLFASDEHIDSILVIFAQLALTALQMRARLLSDCLDGETTINYCEAVANSHKSSQFEQLVSVANYFIDKLTHCLNTADLTSKTFDEWEILCGIIHESLRMSSGIHNNISLAHFHLTQSLSRLVLVLKSSNGILTESVEQIENVYFVTLSKVFVHLRRDFALGGSEKDRRTKSWQTQVTRKADFVSHVANELAECLSLQPSKVTSDRTLIVSPLIKALMGSRDQAYGDYLPVLKLSEAALWFWRHVNNIADKADLVRVRILRPIAAAIIALCGSFGAISDSIRANEPVLEDECDKSDCLSYYFESDDSTNGAFLEEERDMSNAECKMILKKLNQVVQCISLVYSVAEKAPCQEYTPFMSPSHRHGPFLPLVVIRILSNLADNIFRLFSQDVWGEGYPYGARSSGVSLDSILASAYRYVYGFALLGQNQNSLEGSIDGLHLPESIEAAAQLFRCVRRLYHSNRRSIPLRPLEQIEKILPPKQQTPVSLAIQEFLFNANNHTVLNQDKEDLPLGFPEWILDKFYDDELRSQSESDRLRKMVSSELAKGSITNLDSKQAPSCDEDGGSLSGERELTRGHELSLYNKFRAVLDDLSNNPRNVEGWVVLSESCGFKADIICDRLVSTNKSFKSADFRPVPSSMSLSPATMTLDQLKRAQLTEFEESRTTWLPFLGDDLYVYMKYPWSSISSLQACAKDIESKLTGNVPDYSYWKEIQLKFESGDFVTWAQDWAGMFVSALRTMKIRALCVARYLSKTKMENVIMHPSEVCEDIGTALYGDLMGGTSYGYPITIMTSHEKRQIAQCAKSFFEEAIELSLHGNYACKSGTVLWENQFMAGKCLEKIASTLVEEAFTKGEPPVGRYYETVLTHALQTYSSALADARLREQSIGGHGKSETGGSSHGSLEVFYRLHACRFKALLASIRRVNEERESAEREALRITNAVWFGDCSSLQTSSDLRTEIWNAFSNCVKAFMQCRSDEPRFHRAAFRLSQALNWAPLFQNLDCTPPGSEKSRALIAQRLSIPGFGTESFEQNAALVIGSLFDKRRQVPLSQLCAVWVTTSTTPPPFEVLNDSVRKYDTLRLKYIKAFVDCMLVCRQKDKIESLLNHAMSSAQDLAGFYEASAAVRGGDPGRHNKLSLLRSRGFLAEVKRTASDALAELIMYDLVDLKQRGVDEAGKKLLENDFKLANTLFLRLNSHPNEIVQHICSNGPIVQVTALCKCYISIQAGYRINESINFEELDSDTLLSFVEQALQKAKEMFPTKLKQQTWK